LSRILALLLLILLGAAACATAGAPSLPDIYVMRHLQKGAGEDPPLSPEGAANAQRLVQFFKSDPPRAIYVSTTRRARETAEPLAAALRLSLKTYDPRDSAGLAAAVAGEKGPVLIVGHSNTVPDIVAKLGGAAPPPLTDGDYGDIWKIGGRSRAVTKLRIEGR
jgi:broad specificity phosphatase PhoE